MLSVLVMNDPAGQLVETATYCQPGDEKRPEAVGLPDFTLRNVCPADVTKPADEVTDAWPDGWYVRVMFDELLDPNIEELTEIKDPDTGEGTDTYTGSIANTHPVKLECESFAGGGMVEVPYDGYYSPSGNAVTWPLGPSLVIKPNQPKAVATDSECKVTLLDVITDKDGNKVPTDQREFKFRTAPIQVIAIDPPDDPDSEAPIDATQIFFDNVYLAFNTEIDPDSLCTTDPATGNCDPSMPISAKFSHEPGTCSTSGDICDVDMNGADCMPAGQTCDRGIYIYSLEPYGFSAAEFGVGPAQPVKTDTEYTFEIPKGSTATDRCGKVTTFGDPSPDTNTLVHFKTNKFDFNAINFGSGDLISPMKKLQLNFSNVVDGASLADSEWTLTPTPPNDGKFIASTDASGQLQYEADFALNTDYTFTLKAGATIMDPYGATYTQEADKVIHFKTQDKITLAASADETEIVAGATDPAYLTFSFNSDMDLATFTTADFTVTDSTGAASAGWDTDLGEGCSPDSTDCIFIVYKVGAAPGAYKLTLKAGAELKDVLGNTYTQSADKVINFTVKAPTPSNPIQCL